MPLTVFAVKGVPGNRRERIEAAVVAGGKHANIYLAQALLSPNFAEQGKQLQSTCFRSRSQNA
jgi:hypothetical protein